MEVMLGTKNPSWFFAWVINTGTGMPGSVYCQAQQMCKLPVPPWHMHSSLISRHLCNAFISLNDHSQGQIAFIQNPAKPLTDVKYGLLHDMVSEEAFCHTQWGQVEAQRNCNGVLYGAALTRASWSKIRQSLRIIIHLLTETL